MRSETPRDRLAVSSRQPSLRIFTALPYLPIAFVEK